MKKLLLLLVLFSLSCKKTFKGTVTYPDIPAVKACETQTPLYAGEYRYNRENYGQIQIIFLHNNCPTENSNTYVIKGLGEALKPQLKVGGVFPIKDYTVTVTNNEALEFTGTPNFNLKRQSTGNLMVTSPELSTQTSQFVKL